MAKKCKKTGYRDKDLALFALHGIGNKDDGRKKPIRVYECDDCGEWHLTSKPIGDMMKTAFKLSQDWSGVMSEKLKDQSIKLDNG